MSPLPKRKNDGSETGTALTLRDEVNKLFDEFFGGGMWPAAPWPGEWVPALDVSETDKEILVKAEVPGMEPKDIDISLVGDRLSVKGEKKEEKKEQGEDFYRMERRYGAFHRVVTLPATVDPSKVNASYKNGVLTIKLEKKEVAKPKSIEIKVE